LNGEKLKPKSAPTYLKQALVNIGSPVSSESTHRASSSAVAALATKVRGLRMVASASQVMSWVAQGKLSSYISSDLNSWDEQPEWWRLRSLEALYITLMEQKQILH